VTTLASGFRIDAAPGASNVPVVGFQGLVNAASSQPRVAPGSLASLFGANLTLGASSTASLPLPNTLGGTTVTLNDQPVPLLLVTPGQINLQLPFTLTPGPMVLRVSNGGDQRLS
jgi:uncharacterized protein (TIGR03437 family)